MAKVKIADALRMLADLLEKNYEAHRFAVARAMLELVQELMR